MEIIHLFAKMLSIVCFVLNLFLYHSPYLVRKSFFERFFFLSIICSVCSSVLIASYKQNEFKLIEKLI